MSEINKRIISSLAIISLLIISFYNKTFFSLLLLFIFYQLFHEFLNIFRKISNFKKKILLYLLVLTILIYLIALIILIWFIIIHNFNDRLLYLYVIILVCMSTDVGGFVFGKLFKGKKLTKISPNKTYSGLFGSYILAFLSAYLIFNNSFDLYKLLLYVFFVSSVSQLGDLIVSKLKRKAKLKDTGNLIPGHGGLLDRLDGYIFAIPIGIIISYLL